MRSMTIEATKELGNLGRLFLGRFGSNEEQRVEFVDTVEPGIPRDQKWVLMISTQFGCPVGCLLCDAGARGFFGNLSAEQMLAQIEHVVLSRPELSVKGHPKFKIHFARMGEPALNMEVLQALRLLASRYPSPGVLPSLSTVAPSSSRCVEFLEELLVIKSALYPEGRFQLQFSLHGLLDEERDRVVPVPKWTLQEIANYGDRFVSAGDRKVTLNFALAPGTRIAPATMGKIFSPEKFLIKITPVNPTERSVASGTANPWWGLPQELHSDADGLRARGFQVIVSPSEKEEIDAATSCGQLWALGTRSKEDGSSRHRHAGALP